MDELKTKLLQFLYLLLLVIYTVNTYEFLKVTLSFDCVKQYVNFVSAVTNIKTVLLYKQSI